METLSVRVSKKLAELANADKEKMFEYLCLIAMEYPQHFLLEAEIKDSVFLSVQHAISHAIYSQVKSLLRVSNVIDAIKLVREHSGLPLKESKQLVDLIKQNV